MKSVFWTIFKGDIANFTYLLGLKGSSSNSPCPWCKMDRQQITNPKCLKGNSVRTLKDYDQFYEKGEPRQLSDWDDAAGSDLRPLNPVLARLMIASDIQRVDEIIQPGILHFKLRKDLNFLFYHSIFETKLKSIYSFNRMFENAIDPTKWIINYKHKRESASLSEKEKQLEDSCRQIETSVIDVIPRRHGKGSDYEIFSKFYFIFIWIEIWIIRTDGALNNHYTGRDVSTILSRSLSINRKVSKKNDCFN